MQLIRLVRSRASLALVMFACQGLACGDADDGGRGSVDVPVQPDAEAVDPTPVDAAVPMSNCVTVETDGDAVVEHLADFTARFKLGATYDRTVMLFGGEEVKKPNTPSRAYIFGLDKVDAQRMAMKYPDFYLCSSPGGQEAASLIQVYDIVPATCTVYEQLVRALRLYDVNAVKGGDRTSLRLEGAPLTVTSVTANDSGQDVSAQVSGQNFHLVTAVQQLTGESVLNFGTAE